MKKKIFSLWYDKYGRELAKSVLPIDDVDEKEIRRKAKDIFSYTYDIFSEFMCDRINIMQPQITKKMNENRKLYKILCEQRASAEKIKKDLIPYMTELYNGYYKENSIKKEHFESLKKHFGNMLDSCKHTIKNCDYNMIKLNKEYKMAESLLVTE